MKQLSTEQALHLHIQAVKDQDLESIADGYSDDAVFVTVTSHNAELEKSIVKGKQAIRDAFKNVFTNILSKDSSTVEFTNTIVEGEVGYITWKAQSEKFSIPDATDTFIIKKGKIVLQTGLTILKSL